MIIERIKRNSYSQKAVNYYFWRTYDQKEIDFIEEYGGGLYGYEFKWKPTETRAPKDWTETYANASYDTIHPENYFFVYSDLQQDNEKISMISEGV